MTYRELLELYKAGELELEQRKRIEKADRERYREAGSNQ